MNTDSLAAIVDFEVYLLMTMELRVRMSHQEARLKAKLAEHGFSVDKGERIHERVAAALGDETSYFENMKKQLGVADQNATSLEYSSVLWPGFNFTAIANDGGVLESARYRRTTRGVPTADSPIGLPIWSMDVSEFTEQFGPMRGGRQWSMFDKLLPAYEEYEFPWRGESYGAGFSWGLFMFTAKSWD